MEAEKESAEGVEMPGSRGDVSNMVQKRRRVSSMARNSLSSLHEVCLEEDETNQLSLLNFAVMEKACVVTRKRRSRHSGTDESNGDAENCKDAYESLENINASSDNFLVMEKASMATRRRRTKSTDSEDGPKNCKDDYVK